MQKFKNLTQNFMISILCIGLLDQWLGMLFGVLHSAVIYTLSAEVSLEISSTVARMCG